MSALRQTLPWQQHGGREMNELGQARDEEASPAQAKARGVALGE